MFDKLRELLGRPRYYTEITVHLWLCGDIYHWTLKYLGSYDIPIHTSEKTKSVKKKLRKLTKLSKGTFDMKLVPLDKDGETSYNNHYPYYDFETIDAEMVMVYRDSRIWNFSQNDKTWEMTGFAKRFPNTNILNRVKIEVLENARTKLLEEQNSWGSSE